MCINLLAMLRVSSCPNQPIMYNSVTTDKW
uniref:Uncharacterized protein n=1 Tax=Arundo donax TaxID=35708 RepID=A0A0A9EPX6_ARUDO